MMKLPVLATIGFALASIAPLAVAMPSVAAVIVGAPAPIPLLWLRVTLSYKTMVNEDSIGPDRQVGALDAGFGTLKLTFNPDGIIDGTYKPDDGNFRLISGGRTSRDALWIEIGGERFIGHFTRGGIALTSPTSVSGRTLYLAGQFEQP
jgi:hypothetical protein